MFLLPLMERAVEIHKAEPGCCAAVVKVGSANWFLLLEILLLNVRNSVVRVVVLETAF